MVFFLVFLFDVKKNFSCSSFSIYRNLVIMGNARSALARKKRSKTGSKQEANLNSSLPSSQSSRSRVQSKIIGGREFHNEEKSVYVLAKDDEEKDRLHEVGGFLRIYVSRMSALLWATTHMSPMQ
jgi:hypothetical protein